MTAFTDFFPQIFVINLARRKDRWDKCLRQFQGYDIRNFTRFEAYDKPIVVDGVCSGHTGCTASHRAVLEIIQYHKWPRALILEDDFQFRHPPGEFHKRFEEMIGEVPADWEMLYLGASYACKPLGRVSKHVIRANRLYTTSSYAVTWQQARKMAPFASGNAGIDSIYWKWHEEGKTYIFDPRLMVQYGSFSDCQEIMNLHPEYAMEDDGHVKAMDESNVNTIVGPA